MAFREEEYISERVRRNYRQIRDRLGEIEKYGDIRDEVLELLENPRLKVIDRCDEAMGQALFAAGLIDDPSGFARYFDDIRCKKVCSFPGAPGSGLGDHHAYPGGLVNHTSTGIELALATADVYRRAYGLESDREILILAMTLHDVAKATLLAWDDDGTYPKEFPIARTEAHHILSMSEAISRGFPFRLVKAMCHCHVRFESFDRDLRDYLRAAFLIAGKELPVKEVTIGAEDIICKFADGDYYIGKLAMRTIMSSAGSEGLDREAVYKMLSSESEYALFRGRPWSLTIGV